MATFQTEQFDENESTVDVLCTTAESQDIATTSSAWMYNLV